MVHFRAMVDFVHLQNSGDDPDKIAFNNAF